MKRSFSLLLLAGLFLAACSKENPPSASSQPATNTPAAFENPLDAPANYGKALIKAQQTAVKTVDLAALTQAIQLFQVDMDRFPKNLEELVSGKYIGQIPPAPTGMRIVYDPATGTVKMVKQ
jgi:PBP1b-binding outer membrane lipoprotein LpoB